MMTSSDASANALTLRALDELAALSAAIKNDAGSADDSSDAAIPEAVEPVLSLGGGESSERLLAEASVASITIGLMKNVLYETPESQPDKAAAREQAAEILKTTLVEQLVELLPHLEFECRKDATQIFISLLRKHSASEPSAAAWLQARPALLMALLVGYEQPRVALCHGAMLRECIRHESLASVLLREEATFRTVFRLIESPHFDVASDAYATARELLTRHRTTVANFLAEQYDDFFGQYMALVQSENYVTKRQCLKLLGELLLDRSNFAIMSRFISSPEHLKVIMNLLRDASASIQYETFHVFKIFVANPRKEGLVLDLLRRNKERLVTFFDDFLTGKEQQDETFRDEKSFLRDEILKL